MPGPRDSCNHALCLCRSVSNAHAPMDLLVLGNRNRSFPAICVCMELQSVQGRTSHFSEKSIMIFDKSLSYTFSRKMSQIEKWEDCPLLAILSPVDEMCDWHLICSRATSFV